MGGRNYNLRGALSRGDAARYRPIPQCPSVDLGEQCGLTPEHSGDHCHRRSGRTWPRSQSTDQVRA